MKTQLLITSLIALSSSLLPAAPQPLKIEFSFKGVDPIWFSDITSTGAEHNPVKPGPTTALPSLTVESGEKGLLKIIKEFRGIHASTHDQPIHCGVTISCTPRIENGKIIITGTTILRHSAKDQNGAASQFLTREFFLDSQLENGKPHSIPLSGSDQPNEQMIITATLLNPPSPPAQ